MHGITSRIIFGLWAGVAVFIAGRLLDARWHSTHDEFEGAVEQIQAHWLAWLGALIVLVVAAVAVRAPARPRRGYLLTLAGAVSYATVSIWHFVEHANGNDPAVAHVLSVVAHVVIAAGVVWATLESRASSREPRATT